MTPPRSAIAKTETKPCPQRCPHHTQTESQGYQHNRGTRQQQLEQNAPCAGLQLSAVVAVGRRGWRQRYARGENERLEAELQGKIGALKSLTIDIGHEVRYQDKVLRGIDDDMDRTGGFLGNTMSRVVRLGRNGHQGYMCYMFLFVVFVFFVLYITLKLRG